MLKAKHPWLGWGKKRPQLAGFKPGYPQWQSDPLYEEIQEVLDELNQAGPIGVNMAYQTSEAYRFAQTEKALVRNLISGMLLAGLCALIVLVGIDNKFHLPP
ncbi:MAG: hypothetical protein AAF337_03020 [Pseudomonadota bacterium]